MLNTKINNHNYTTTTNYMLQGIAELELEAQQTSTPAPVAQETPKYTKTQKTIKTPKTATVSTTFKSFSTQRGYYIPSQNKNSILEVAHTTTLNISCITLGYTLTCKVNGEQQVSVIGDDCNSDWKIKLQAGDRVEVEVLGGQSAQVITYVVNEDGVVASASKGVKHSIKGTHKADLDIQDKYRKAAVAQTVAPAEEATVEAAPAQIEEETAPVAAQVEEKALDFGKHTGKLISNCETSYLKWLVAHESRLLDGRRWASTAAKIELERRAQEKAA